MSNDAQPPASSSSSSYRSFQPVHPPSTEPTEAEPNSLVVRYSDSLSASVLSTWLVADELVLTAQRQCHESDLTGRGMKAALAGDMG